MSTFVEVGAVISDLESEYERSKKFLDDLYRTLGARHGEQEEHLCRTGPVGSPGQANEEGTALDPGALDAHRTYELPGEDSCVSSCSENSTTFPRLPELRTDCRALNVSQSHGHKASVQKRDDIQPATPVGPKKKVSSTAILKKLSNNSASCPALELPAADDQSSQTTSLGGGLDCVPQGRHSSIYPITGPFIGFDSAPLAQVLTGSPQAVSAARHRRSSLDFIPAPPAHLRKWFDSTLLGGQSPFSGQESVPSRQPSQPAQPNKARSLEVHGSHANSALSPISQTGTLAAMTATMPRQSHMGGMQPNRRGTTPQLHGINHDQQQQPSQQQHSMPWQLDLPVANTAPVPAALSVSAAHLSKAVADLAVQTNAGHSKSLADDSPSRLPPLQPTSSPHGSLAALSGNSKSLHSSIEFGPGGGKAVRGCSWSGLPQPVMTPSPPSEPPPQLPSPGERPRAARFSRCGPSQHALTPFTSAQAQQSPTAAAAASGTCASQPLTSQPLTSPTSQGRRDRDRDPDRDRDRERRTTSSCEVAERLVPRMSSLLHATSLAQAPALGVSLRSSGFALQEGLALVVDGVACEGEPTEPATQVSPLRGPTVTAVAASVAAAAASSGSHHFHHHHQHSHPHPHHPAAGRTELWQRSGASLSQH